jgi:hypothetical protein
VNYFTVAAAPCVPSVHFATVRGHDLLDTVGGEGPVVLVPLPGKVEVEVVASRSALVWGVITSSEQAPGTVDAAAVRDGHIAIEASSVAYDETLGDTVYNDETLEGYKQSGSCRFGPEVLVANQLSTFTLNGCAPDGNRTYKAWVYIASNPGTVDLFDTRFTPTNYTTFGTLAHSVKFNGFAPGFQLHPRLEGTVTHDRIAFTLRVTHASLVHAVILSAADIPPLRTDGSRDDGFIRYARDVKDDRGFKSLCRIWDRPIPRFETQTFWLEECSMRSGVSFKLFVEIGRAHV